MKRCCCLLLLICNTAFADAVTQLDVLMKKITTYSANFSQVVKTKKTNQKTSGLMLSKKPNLFRWEVKAPHQQVILADGKNLLNYDVELEQVTKQPYSKKNLATASLFLVGDIKKLQQEYTIVLKACQKVNAKRCFKLTPKDPNHSIQYMVFGFSSEKLQEIYLLDQLGQETNIKFSKMKLNKNIKDTDFKLELPDDVDVVELES